MREEITSIVNELNLTREVLLFDNNTFSNDLINKIKSKFVIGNPRVWWLDFLKEPVIYSYNTKFLYEKIIIFFDETTIVWIVIEDDINILLLTSIHNFLKIVAECSYFEYNIINLELTKLVCENEHDQLLVIEL